MARLSHKAINDALRESGHGFGWHYDGKKWRLVLVDPGQPDDTERPATGKADGGARGEPGRERADMNTIIRGY